MDIIDDLFKSLKNQMVDIPRSPLPADVYDEELDDETTLDLSSMSLTSLPELINIKILRVVYLQNNELVTLPDDFFPSLPCLMWLDLRNNRLTDIPKTILGHPCLTHLLLQNNCLTSLPDEMGTLNLKVLQLQGNPLMYPPLEVLKGGVQRILKFLHDRHIDNIFVPSCSDISEGQNVRPPEKYDAKNKNELKIKLTDKEDEKDEDGNYEKIKGKCPKLDKSRHIFLPKYGQSTKYLKPLFAPGKRATDEKIKLNYLKDLARKKKADLITAREKILQERKTLEQLKKWRQNYRSRQMYNCNASYRLEPSTFPYDISPEYLTLLSREDIEKDLPDKYRKSITRKSRPSVARQNNGDVHLAMKIKKLFENLEAIDLNRERMTPRTEQKVLLNEIQKISEIKEKLSELSNANNASVTIH